MSGPKVVRIVSREEFIAISEASLRRLDGEIRRWERSLDQHESDTQGVIEATRRRREALHAELAADNFDGLSKRIAGEMAFLRQDRDERIERVAQRVATERRRQRRLASAAGELLAEIERRSGVEAPAALRASLEAAERRRSDADAAQGAINEALVLLAGLPASASPGPGPDVAASQRRRELARRLMDESAADGSAMASVATLAAWLSGREDEALPESSHPAHPATLRVEPALALFELEAVGEQDAAGVAAFTERAARLADEPSARRRAQLADSLVLELAAATGRRRRLNTLMAETEALVADLADLAPGATALAPMAAEIVAIGAAGANADTDAIDALEALGQRLRSEIDQHRGQAAATARRRLVLDAMAELGYQVREGMQTAWAEQGRIVLGRAGMADDGGYGVELGGGADAERLQLRTVAFGADPGRTATDDIAAETRWCGELDQLKAIAAAAGGELVVERARAVGEVPVKVVATASVAASAVGRRQRERERREPSLRRQRRD